MMRRRISRSGPRRTRLRQRGIALAMTLFTLVLLALAVATSTLIASADIRATRNYRGASEVHFVAESALSEAVQRLNAVGVVDFQNDVVGRWPSTWGPVKHGFAPLPGFTYTVTPVPSAADPAAAGQLVATADGPEGEHNVTVANVVRSNIPSAAPGAIYLATDATTNTVFHGGILAVSGSDHDCARGARFGPAGPRHLDPERPQHAGHGRQPRRGSEVHRPGAWLLVATARHAERIDIGRPPASRRWASSSTIS